MIRHYLVESGKKDRCRQKTAKTCSGKGNGECAWVRERGESEQDGAMGLGRLVPQP